MGRARKQPKQHGADRPAALAQSRRRWWPWLLLLLAAAALLWRPVVSAVTREAARANLRAGDLGAALQWTARGRWAGRRAWQPLLRAAAARRAEQWEVWRAELETAGQSDAPPEQLLREERLGRIAMGQVEDLRRVAELLGGLDVAPDEAREATIAGAAATQQLDLAAFLVGQWAEERPGDANARYWQGRLAELHRAGADAEQAYRAALAAEPRHLPAAMALASLLERTDRLEEAATLTIEIWRRDGHPPAQVAAARVLRRQGRLTAARQVLGDLDRPAADLERGRIAFEQGRYEQAIELLAPAPAGGDDELLAAALHLAGRDQQASDLHAEIARRNEASHRADDEATRRRLAEPNR